MQQHDIFEVIRTRRSVRSFSDEPVDRDTLRALAECASWAPTGSNIQAWYFGIVDDKKMIQNIKSCSPGLFGDPAAIFVMCINKKAAIERSGEEIGVNIISRMDVALAGENLMLAAHAIGLGTCMVYSFNNIAVHTLLDLPDDVQIEVLITLGKPNKKLAKGIRKPLDEVIFFNEWKGK